MIDQVRDLQRRLATCLASVERGNLELRVTGIDDDHPLAGIAWGVDNLLDKVETFTREAMAALEDQSDSGQRRIDPRGFHHTFEDLVERFNASLDRASELRAELAERERDQACARRDLQIMLENLGQGFLTVGPDGVVAAGGTRASHHLFGRDPTGLHLVELLRAEDEAAAGIRDWLDLLFGGVLGFEDVVDLGPTSFRKHVGVVRLEYRPIHDDDGVLKRLIVIATDVTREQALEDEARREREQVQMLVGILRDRSAFAEFVRETRSQLAEVRGVLAADEVDVAAVYRHVHSIKGGAAAFHLTAVRDRAHEAERELGRIRDHGEAWTRARQAGSEAAVAEIEAALDETLAAHAEVIGEIEGADELRVFELSELQALVDGLDRELGRERSAYRQAVDTLLLSPAHALFERFGKVVAGVAERQDKSVDLRIVPSAVRVYDQAYRPLLAACVHLFRNAVDHGIEAVGERADAGKDETAAIAVTIEELAGNRMRIGIADDGRGMDPDAIAAKAVAKGVITAEQVADLDDAGKLALVLRPGFSTRDEVSQWSGRGVGLDAVAYQVRRLDGEIRIESSPGHGTRVVLELPIIRGPWS